MPSRDPIRSGNSVLLALRVALSLYGFASCVVAGPPTALGEEARSTERAQSITLPLFVHVADTALDAASDPAFVAQQLARANAIFAPYGIAFEQAGTDVVPARHARISTREQRDAFGAHLRGGFLNVFIVAELMDVDEPGKVRRGVHWRVRDDPSKHFVIVSVISMLNVLAHELGHFLGNPKHSQLDGNLMSYRHTEALPVLDEDQQRRVHRAVAQLCSTGELRRQACPGRARSSNQSGEALSR